MTEKFLCRFFSALWDFFWKMFSMSPKGPPSYFFLFCSKIPRGPLLQFSALCDLPETKKIRKFHKSLIFFQFFPHAGTVEENTWHFEVLLLFLSLRYGTDLGRSRLVFFETNEVTDFICFMRSKSRWRRISRRSYGLHRTHQSKDIIIYNKKTRISQVKVHSTKQRIRAA